MIESASKPSKSPAVNVGAQQVALIYAKAFLGAVQKAGNADALVEELAALSDVLSQHPRLETVFGSALIEHEEKVKLLDRLFAARLSPLVLDFLKVISHHGRLDLVRAIQWEVAKLYDEQCGRVRVQLRTATPLDEALARNLSEALRKILGGEPKIESSVESALIGGVVLRVGDTVYDGSVARQLRQVREQMINRSVHEIQSRRDRFRHPGGN